MGSEKSRFDLPLYAEPKTGSSLPPTPTCSGSEQQPGCQYLVKNPRPEVAADAAFRDPTGNKYEWYQFAAISIEGRMTTKELREPALKPRLSVVHGSRRTLRVLLTMRSR